MKAKFVFNINVYVGDTTGDVARLRAELHEALKAQRKVDDMQDKRYTDLISSFNDETNNIAARLDAMDAKIRASGMTGDEETAALGELTAVRDRLRALGANPADPIPPDTTTGGDSTDTLNGGGGTGTDTTGGGTGTDTISPDGGTDTTTGGAGGGGSAEGFRRGG